MTYLAEVEGVGLGKDGDYNIVLRANEKYLIIPTTADQARSIQMGLEEINEQQGSHSRPLTHDIFIHVISEMGGVLDGVVIDDIENDTFVAKVYFEHYRSGERKEIPVDTRPSDAIALGIREKCGIEITEKVLEKAGKPIEEVKTKNPEDH